MLINEKKIHYKSGEIYTDKESLKHNNFLRVKQVSKPSTKHSKPVERKEQNTESASSRKRKNDQFQTKEKSVIILGDSMMKHLNGYEISGKLPCKCKVYVRNFPGSKTRGMKDYLKPPLRRCGRSPELIVESIADLVASLKVENHEVSISNIIVRTHNQELREKAVTVNKKPSQIC